MPGEWEIDFLQGGDCRGLMGVGLIVWGGGVGRNMQVSGSDITIRDTVIDAFTSGGFPFNT